MKNISHVVGITGGIGSGKSTVSAIFSKHNIPCISLDTISKQLVQPNTLGLTKIIHLFGTKYLDHNGQLNRQQLKQLIFSNPVAKKQLESILHPLIKQEVINQLQQLKPKHPLIIIEIPLLTEKGKPDYIDKVLVCDCPEELQIERVLQRDNVNRQEITQIIQQQATRAERLAIADDVINTKNSLSDTNEQVENFIRKAHNYNPKTSLNPQF